MSQEFKKNARQEKPAVRPSGATATPPQSQTNSLGPASRWTTPGICVFLALIVWIVFAQTSRFDFINFDDGVYVYKDPVVTRGLTLEGVAAAFSDRHSDNWVPLTTISHMLDCQFFGLDAGDHHVINVILHTATVILLFLALREMTGFLWRSAFVAAVFAIHPLRVESVAWIAERKDVLSGVFFTLTLWTYVRYVRSLAPPKRSEGGPLSSSHSPLRWYLATLFCFILGLMSKPTVITLPCVLLLLDYWPLGRFSSDYRLLQRLFIEKIPLFMLSFACCVPTILAERAGIKPLQFYPLHLRIENAIVSYVIQIERLFYPANLAIAYPYPVNGIPWWEVALAGTFLVGICAIVWAQRRTRPWLLVGWLWYVGMITPNIGFIQVGDQAQADRHTYLPQIGLYLSLAWLAADLCAIRRWRRGALGGLSAAILVVLVFSAHIQAGYWRNSETLWTHAVTATSGNFIAHNNLGDILMEKGQPDAAIAQYRISLKINPDAEVYDNLGNALVKMGNVEEAYSDFQTALRLQSNDPNAWSGLGNLYLQEGQTVLAIQNFQKALQIQPAFPMACYDLGNAYIQDHQMDLAIRWWQKAVALQPGFPMAHNNLGNASMLQGRVADAIQQWKAALKYQPDLSSAQMNLAWVLATCPDPSLRDGAAALALAQHASQLSGGQNPVVLRALAAAYAENGQFPDAIATAQLALQISSQSNPRLAASLQSQLKSYQNNQPFRDQSLAPR